MHPQWHPPYATPSFVLFQGLRRVKDGHQAPYRLKYIQLGNEQVRGRSASPPGHHPPTTTTTTSTTATTSTSYYYYYTNILLQYPF